ncbi:MAG TPA: hypothetical protein VF165_07405, partial [Nocardioidaceae bacterium]
RSKPTTAPPTAAPRRVVAPDDDEDFLRELERRRRKAAREGKADKPAPKPEQGHRNQGETNPESKPEGPTEKRPKPE